LEEGELSKVGADLNEEEVPAQPGQSKEEEPLKDELP